MRAALGTPPRQCSAPRHTTPSVPKTPPAFGTENPQNDPKECALMPAPGITVWASAWGQGHGHPRHPTLRHWGVLPALLALLLPPRTAAATTPRRWPRPLGRGGRPVTHVGTVPRYGTAGLAPAARSSPPFPGIFSPEINNSSGSRHRLPERGGRGAARHPKQTEPPSQRLCPADSSSRTFKYTPGPRGG